MKTTILQYLWYSMGKITKNSVLELISSHCCTFDVSSYICTMSLPGASCFQLDYLRFYVPVEKWLLYGTPWDRWFKDNPNREPTDYQNVYKLTDSKYSLYSYNLSGVAPVSVLRWEKVNIKKEWKVQELIQVCIYWKWLKLYYSWHLSWLKDFVIRYGWECTRVDLCWDFKQKLPGEKYQGDYRTDLKPSGLYLNREATDYDTIYYGKKHSPFMIRIYNKTQDLRKDNNIHSFLYPKWYMKECRRYEIEMKGKYASSNSAIDWLEIQSRDLQIQKLERTKRNNFKTALYSLINCIDVVNYDDWEKILILQNTKDLITNKLKFLITKSK